MEDPTSIDKIRERVRDSVLRKEETEHGYDIILEDNVFSELSQFTQHESECCSFLAFRNTEGNDELKCEVRCTDDDLDITAVKEVIKTLFE